MTLKQKRDFIAFYLGISDLDARVEVLIGALKAGKKKNGLFRFRDLLPKGHTITDQGVKKALRGDGDALRHPGCTSDLVRQNAAAMLGVEPSDLWHNLYG